MKKLFKNWIFWVFLISLAGSVVGYYLWQIYDCGYSSFCNQLIFEVGPQLYYSLIALAIIFLILLFVPRAVRAWRKFAWWYIPITVIFVWWPDETSTGGWDLGPSNSEFALILGSLYVGVSLGIIGVSILSERRQRSGKKKLNVLWYWLSGVVLGVGAMLIVSPYMRLLVEWIMAGARL